MSGKKGWGWFEHLLGKFAWYRKGLRYSKELRTIRWRPWLTRGQG